jgi:hypothetical protein
MPMTTKTKTKAPVARKTKKSASKASSPVLKSSMIKLLVENGFDPTTRSNLVMACKTAGVDPKIVRAHLRKAGIAKPYDPTQDAIRAIIANVASRKH